MIDYENIVLNKDLISVIDRLIDSIPISPNTPQETVNQYLASRQMMRHLKEKSGESFSVAEPFTFIVNSNLTVSKVMQLIERLQITDIHSELMTIKGDVFYKSDLTERAEIREQGGGSFNF